MCTKWFETRLWGLWGINLCLPVFDADLPKVIKMYLCLYYVPYRMEKGPCILHTRLVLATSCLHFFLLEWIHTSCLLYPSYLLSYDQNMYPWVIPYIYSILLNDHYNVAYSCVHRILWLYWRIHRYQLVHNITQY